ncbi:MAG: tRNA 2-thiocytidine biosynthesis protein TtcA [Negativicutes bacterium]|nr:tRNA 2-thiocytidine biosynthesis protein TtcA [Negativicutes bacterium]
MSDLIARMTGCVERAIYEFGLIEPGDQLLLGFSGGKDSLLLLHILDRLRRGRRHRFSLSAASVDAGFSPGSPCDQLTRICRSYDVPLALIRENIAAAVAADGCPDPCYGCSRFRRAALSGFASRNGFTRLILGHHLDDAVETFLMNLLFNGRLAVFSPKSHLDRQRIWVIRPLCYAREREVAAAVAQLPHQPVKPSCPYAGHTSRQRIKTLLNRWESDDPRVFSRLAAAMRCANPELWPPPLTRRQLRERYLSARLAWQSPAGGAGDGEQEFL